MKAKQFVDKTVEEKFPPIYGLITDDDKIELSVFSLSPKNLSIIKGLSVARFITSKHPQFYIIHFTREFGSKNYSSFYGGTYSFSGFTTEVSAYETVLTLLDTDSESIGSYSEIEVVGYDFDKIIKRAPE